MGKKLKKERIELCYGEGKTTLFLLPNEDGGFQLLDYEYHAAQIHEIGGGRILYESNSGYTGNGYIEKYGELIPVGFYRVDTASNSWQFTVEVADKVEIMFPYTPHNGVSVWGDNYEGKDPLKEFPVVIKNGESLVYCDFYTNMNKVLERVLLGENLEGKRTLCRSFVDTDYLYSKEVKFDFYNFFGRKSVYPWEFMTDMLRDFQAPVPEERIYQLFHLTKVGSKLVKTARIAGELYATEICETDPCENKDFCFKGWSYLADKMLYKVREDNVYIIGWVLAEPAYRKKFERLSRFIPSEEQEAFKAHFEENLPKDKFIEFEVSVPKLLFFLNKGKQIANVRKGISQKVSRDVFAIARQYVQNFNDKEILKTIPDDFVIKFEDSLSSGNCQPGTQQFVNLYFPGKTETTAGELKKYAENWNVMRIFRYIASREGFVGDEMKLPEESQ